MSWSTLTIVINQPPSGNGPNVTTNTFTKTLVSSSYPEAVTFTQAIFKQGGIVDDTGLFLPSGQILFIKIS